MARGWLAFAGPLAENPRFWTGFERPLNSDGVDEVANRVTVVIPTLNEELHLPRCIASLRALPQGRALDIVVVDNGSTDRTVELGQQAGARVYTLGGVTIAAQRNHGVAQSERELVAFLDADCTVSPQWLARGVQHFEDPRVVAAGAPPGIPSDGTTWVQRTWSFLKRRPGSGAFEVAWLPSANLWVRRSAFERAGGFDPAFETCEDADLGFRLARLGRIVCDREIRVEHHREPRTVGEFFRKELWHGRNSFDGVLKGRFSAGEVPSLLAPVWTLAWSLAACAAVLFPGWAITGTTVAATALLAVPAAYTVRTIVHKGHVAEAPRFFWLYCVYFAARTCALASWAWRRVRGARSSRLAGS